MKVGAAVFVSAVGLLGGCANQQNLDKAMDENRSLKNQNSELQALNSQLKNENELMQKQRMESEAALSQARGMSDEMRKQLGMTEADYKKLLERLNSLSLSPIDPETDRALAELARAHPDLISYDSEHGILRFSADLTFDSGQDKVKDGAAQSLAALAKILKTTSASSYEVMVVGHTDAQKISAGTAQRHPTNMHLSCHRAIAVRQILDGQGVPAEKMYAAGWGDERPIAQNGPKGESAANRRVEIYLTRPTATAGLKPKSAPTATVPTAREPDMTK